MRIIDTKAVIQALAPVVPSSAAPAYVSLKDYGKCTVIISVANGTTVTGSAITLNQATAVAGTSAKTLAFTQVFANADCTTTSQTLTATTVTNVFTTATTDSKNLLYVIEVDPRDMDAAGGFDCLQVGVGNATRATVSATYILSHARYPQATAMNALAD
jgi:hypothetical protein